MWPKNTGQYTAQIIPQERQLSDQTGKYNNIWNRPVLDKGGN